MGLSTVRDCCEYLLAARPGGPVAKMITDAKNWLVNKYANSDRQVINDESCITIAQFVANESMEETIIRWIGRVLGQAKSFEVTLNNYGGFPPPCIYLRIMDHEPFAAITAELMVIDDYLISNGYPSARFFKKPQLVISEKIDQASYVEAIFDYSQQTFHERFWITEFVLVKRTNEFDKTQTVSVFRLYPPDTHRYGRVA